MTIRVHVALEKFIQDAVIITEKKSIEKAPLHWKILWRLRNTPSKNVYILLYLPVHLLFRILKVTLNGIEIKNFVYSADLSWLFHLSFSALREAFSEFDKNKDGFISQEELTDAMTSFGHVTSNEDVEQMIKVVDSDGELFLIKSKFGGCC